jgi:hypothetical protein
MNPRKFHLSRDGQTLGPYSDEELRQFLAEGRLTANDFVWWEGQADWRPASEVFDVLSPDRAAEPAHPVSAEPALPAVAYHHVAPLKFAILSVATLGLYDLFWFYKNWKYVRQRDQSGIRPFWRALFSPIWCYALARDVAARSNRLSPTFAGVVALFYVALVLASRLPDPWWLLTFATFIPLLAVVREIGTINRELGVRSAYYARFGPGSILACLLGMPFVAWSVLLSINLLPSTQVVDGGQLSAWHRNFLRMQHIIEETEQIRHFYSIGVFSIKDDGNLVTDQRIISYWRDPDSRELVIESARYEEVRDIQFERGSPLSDSTLTVVNQDGSKFILLLSTEADGDQRCLETAQGLWRQKRPAPP